jgi:co-chaperonin GroES (HSP10)
MQNIFVALRSVDAIWVAYIMPLPTLNPRIESFRPTGKKALVKRQVEESLKDGIFLPENRAQVGLVRGTVVEVGAALHAETGIKQGDTLIYPRQLGYQRVEYRGDPHEVVPVESIFAVEAS